jgi:hypothetical protein
LKKKRGKPQKLIKVIHTNVQAENTSRKHREQSNGSKKQRWKNIKRNKKEQFEEVDHVDLPVGVMGA